MSQVYNCLRMPPTTKYKQLTREEEQEHFRRWREDGDQSSYAMLVESQLPWALKLCRKFTRAAPGSFAYDEAEAGAYEGVVRAVNSFDPSLGNRLTTYVFRAVQTHVNRVDPGGAVRLAPLCNNNYSPEERAAAFNQLGGQQTIGPRWDDDKFGYEPSFTDSPLATLIDEESVDATRRRIEWALQFLEERERLVIKRRFMDEKTLEEVGAEIGVTRERVRQIESSAMSDLRCVITKWKPRYPAPKGIMPAEPDYPETKENPVEGNDLLSLIDRVSQGEIEREIKSLEEQRAAATYEFDRKIEKLTGLRNAMFGDPKKAARRHGPKTERSPTVNGATLTEPSPGSKVRAIWDLLKQQGALHVSEIAVRLDEDSKRVASTLAVNIPRWFRRTGVGVYAVAHADEVAVEVA